VKTYKSYLDLPGAPLADVPSQEESVAGWRTHRPIIDLSTCTKCYLCWKYCPDAAISVNSEGWPVIRYEHCKGCGICSVECPKECIAMEKEE